MRKVLVVAYYFPPMGLSGVQRTLKFVKYLPEHGWHPLVLTTNSPAYYAYDDTMLDELDSENITIYRTDEDITKYAKKRKKKGNTTLKYPSRANQVIRRALLATVFQPDSRILWKKSALKTAEKIIEENEIEAIYATAPPFTDFLVAHELAEKYNLPFIVDYRDLWVDNAFYIYPTPFHRSYAMKLESRILKKASKVIVINRFMKEALIKRYNHITYNDIAIIPHGYDPDDFTNAQALTEQSDKFVITHSGLFPDDLTPEYFLKGLKAFLDKNPNAKNVVEARFIGILRKEHLKLIEKLDLQKVCKLTGYIPHSDAVENLMESDVLWMMITNNIATPSRMYEYFGAGKAMIVCAPEGNIRDLADSSGAAYTCGVKDVASIAYGIEQYYQLWKHKKLPSVDAEFAQQFDRKSLTGELSRELMLSLSNS